MENTEKITFLVPIEKEVKRTGKRGDKITNTISSRLKFLDSAIFMASLISIILLKEFKKFIKLNVNMDTITKTVRHVELNTEMVHALFEYKTEMI